MTTTMTQPFQPPVVTQGSLSPRISAPQPNIVERFPSFDSGSPNPNLHTVSESPLENTPSPPVVPEYKWPTRKSRQSSTLGHKSRRSVSDALHKFRTRQGSVSENAQELAEALKAPVSYKLIILCILWYLTSALTNTSSKSILNAFPKPATLTIVQFASVSSWCFIAASLASIFPSLKKSIPALKNGLRTPSWDVIATALPLSVFQLLGHLLSSYATSKIPVSLVHTIKGLSPLFTVLAYRLVFRIRYRRATYLSLVPLTVGVMMACSTDFSTNFWGITASFVAAIVFVTQNIFSKKLFTESSRADAEGFSQKSRKLDKLNLLCYCSVGAFMFSAPVWLYTEGFTIMQDFWKDGAIDLTKKKGSLDQGELVLEFLFNGIFHFLQNILAFVLLSMLSPVSYSVASLIKRVWVIIVAVLWFRSTTTSIQLVGIALTMVGLYLYDRTSMEDAAERRTRSDHFRPKTALLPVTEMDDRGENGNIILPRRGMNERTFAFHESPFHDDDDDSVVKADNPPFGTRWPPPGTR